ncbi:hypothetical protein PISMIDRAFT_19219 [Pisolithus microcarpus 441]|uniref:Selenoprotein O n=1 Tax=Pisolithus microcarpus 441 TaxID=765257 RepID=A0A0C9YV62_9AGAM|nr:hypothetical protein BKA83DRAFT_19219 [Pisolithus microcarpus]KIK11793.1 hypothetical protein PISMIDRAFT_19219 [Pisolithus microcarpus 441]
MAGVRIHTRCNQYGQASLQVIAPCGYLISDNVSIAGLTIDYGPYAFMDVFDPHHICNDSDQEGVLTMRVPSSLPVLLPCLTGIPQQQPNMILYACRALLDALAPLIGTEIALGKKAVQRSWVDNVSDKTVSEWRAAAIKEVGSMMNQIIESACASEYGMALHRRLALRRVDPSDQRSIFRPLLDMIENHRLDFHVTFRRLAFFRLHILRGDADSGATALEGFIAGLLEGTPESERLDTGRAAEKWHARLDTFAARIESDKTSGEWGEDFDEARKRAAMAANPRFVLRQLMLEGVIENIGDDPATGKHVLGKVMQVSSP